MCAERQKTSTITTGKYLFKREKIDPKRTEKQKKKKERRERKQNENNEQK